MTKKLTKRISLFTLSLLLAIPAISQTGRISGVIIDKTTGETLPGAHVVIEETAIGVSAAIDGTFLLDNVPVGELQVTGSFIGYIAQTLTVWVNAGQTTVVTFQLDPEALALEEFLVIGYGVQRRSDLTGAVAKITAEDMNRGVLADPIQGLQSRVAGVLITKQGGDPNAGFSVRIRGASSLATDASPLFVIDGVPGADPTTIAPEDIESFNVLKDASATAIYGARGANGVIIITTKRGIGKVEPVVEFSSFYALDNVANRLDLLSADQFRDFLDENPDFKTGFIDGEASTDWQDEVYRTGSSQNYNITIAGGDVNTNYRASVAHSKLTGVIRGSARTRTIGRINLDQRTLDDRLRISSGLSGSFEHNDFINYGGWGADQVLFQTFQRNPTDPVRSAGSPYFGGYHEIERVFQYFNPLGLIDQIYNERDAKRYFGFLRADLELFKGFEAGINLAYTRDDEEGFYFEPTTLYLNKHDGFGRKVYNNSETKLLEATLRYSNTFGNHSLQALGGYSWQEDMFTGFRVQGRQPILNYTMMHDMSLFQRVVPGDIASYKNNSRLISFFARGIYNWNNRYFLTATIRRDGSSKFGAHNQWGWFPSASAAWNITAEEFMNNLPWLNNLRLRVGYGIAGNQEIGLYNHIAYYRAAGNTINFETGEESILFEFAHTANPNLRWESNAELNVGIDYGFLEDRISGSIDFFHRTTFDLLGLYSVPVPPNPVPRIWANVGEFQVTGLEFFIQAFPVRTRNFDWRTSLVFSTYRQEVVSLSNDQFQWARMQVGWLSGPGLVGAHNWTQTVEPGIPIGTWFMPEYAGLSGDGMFLFYTEAGGVTRNMELAERRVVGSAQPDFELGWSNLIDIYDNFDVSFSFRAVYGHEIFNTTRLIFGNPIFLPDRNVLVSAIDEYERGLRDSPKVSNYYLEDGSFLRLDNISIGYNLRNVGYFDRIRVYVASNNVFTLTNYSGIDPEINFTGLSFGLDQYNIYPKTRTLMLGVNVTL